jgi:hypothetical protein
LMVFASFLLFVPTLMSRVYHTSSALAAQAGSVYALGCLLAVTLGSKVYGTLSRPSKLWTLACLLGMAAASSVGQLGNMSGWWTLSPSASLVLLFMWGLAFAIPFYIPPSLYALQYGGKQSSATISDVFDVGGFALLACFNGYTAGIEHSNPAAWIRSFQITTICAVTSYLTLSWAAWRDIVPVQKELSTA